MKVAAYATIKLNSERVPNKNIRPIGSKPLCFHILDTALQVTEIDDVYVYCSDEKVINYIPDKVIFKKRDARFDRNEAKAKEIYSAFINEVDADIYIALCTTSPFTQKKTLEHALKKVLYEGYDSAFSAKRMQTFVWYKGQPINYDIANVPRTQDMEPVFIETSAFFIFRKEIWKEHGRRIGFNPYIQEVGEIEGIDIDTMEEYEFANMVAQNVLKL